MVERARSLLAILAGAACFAVGASAQGFNPPAPPAPPSGMGPPPDMQGPAMPAPPSFTPPSFTPPAPPTDPCGPGVTHCQSSSSSSSSGFSFGFGPSSPPPGYPPPWGPPPPSPARMAGQWTLGQADSGATCTLKLYAKADAFGLRRAWTGVGCPDGFFNVARWRIAGREVQLTDLMGNPIGGFHLVGPGQLEGYRMSDHARLFLSR
jgi:hypothetical protein